MRVRGQGGTGIEEYVSIGVTSDQARSDAASKEERQLRADREFEQTFLDHWPRIYRVLFRLVGDRAEAEDLALETFWRLYRDPPRSGGANPGSWLYRVATNLGLNALRARKRRASYELKAGGDEAVLLDPSGSLEAVEERERVQQVLGRMDPRQAQLLILRHSGLDYQDLASALGLSSSSIGSLLTRAEREFTRIYQEMG